MTTEPIEVEQRRRRAQIRRELARDVVREEIETVELETEILDLEHLIRFTRKLT